MKTVSLVISIIILSVTMLFADSPKPVAISEPTGGMVCMTEMKDAFEPARSSIRQATFITTNDFGEKAELICGQAYKTFPDGKKMILTLLGPSMTGGTTYLFWEKGNQVERWLYIGGIDRVRKLQPTWPYESFFNTEFTSFDIGFIPLSESCKMVEETKYNGVNAYKVEEKISEGIYYSRIVTWVAAGSFLPLKRDYYDAKGKLWKSMLIKEVVTVDDVPTPLTIEMKDLYSGLSTELRISKVSHDVNIPDEFFDPKQLAKVPKSPLWRENGIQPQKER